MSGIFDKRVLGDKYKVLSDAMERKSWIRNTYVSAKEDIYKEYLVEVQRLQK